MADFLNLQPTADNYDVPTTNAAGLTAPCTLEPSPGVQQILFSVLDEPVLALFWRYVEGIEGKFELETIEREFVANSIGILVTGAAGVKFRSKIAGTPATIAGEMDYRGDIKVQGGAISPSSISSQGQIVAGTAVSIPDGSDAAEGSKADAAYAGAGSASLVAILKGIYAKLAGTLVASVSGAVSVTNFPGTQPVSGTVSVTPSAPISTAQATSTGTGDVKTIAVPANAHTAILSAETNDARVTFDGSTPSATNGLEILHTGSSVGPYPVTPGGSVKVASTAAGNCILDAVFST